MMNNITDNNNNNNALDRYMTLVGNRIRSEINSRGYLQTIFGKFMEKARFLQRELRQLERASDIQNAQSTNLKEQIIKIKTFTLHYFSRGALIPILHEKEIGHRSPLDYMNDDDNYASYYRGDGHALARRLLEHFLGDYSEDIKAGVIAPLHFNALIRTACTSTKCQYFEFLEIEKITNPIDKSLKAFCDITPWIKNQLGNSPSRSKCIQLIKTMQDHKCPADCLVGGVIQMSPEVGFYVFFTKKIDHFHASILGDFLNLRGTTGAFPEMIELKKRLAIEHDPLRDIEPFDEKIDSSYHMKGMPKKLETVIENLEKFQLNSSNHPFALYIKVIVRFLKAFQKEHLHELSEQNSSINKIMSSSLQTIEDEIEASKLNSNFYQQLQNIYAAVEEVILLSLFFNPLTTYSLEDILKKLFSKDLHDRLTLFTFNNGMACHNYIIQAFNNSQSIEKSDNNNEIPKPNLGIIEGSYYEISEWAEYLRDKWEVRTIEPDAKCDLNVDLLLLDLYPNNVTEGEMKPNNVQGIIDEALKNQPSSSPLTVVLDVSTTLFSDPTILQIANHFQSVIDKGKLILVISSSLAKFYSCGLDKYTGGAVAVVGPKKGSESPIAQAFIKNLKEARDTDFMSKEAIRFFSLLLENASEEIQVFYDIIIQNTQMMYDALCSKKYNNLSIKMREGKIPMIGISLKEFHAQVQENTVKELENNNQKMEIGSEKTNSTQEEMTESEEDHAPRLEEQVKKLEKQFYQGAQNNALPLLIRASFPFPHSAIIECKTALRLVVGLDIGKYKDDYIKLFDKVDQEWDTH